MSAEVIAAQLASPGVGGAGAAAPSALTSGADQVQSFNAAFAQAQAAQVQAPADTSIAAVMSPLLNLGQQSTQLASQANPLMSNDLRPGELLQITMQSHQFLFHCELVANVANRASDGVQQLFRQQS